MKIGLSRITIIGLILVVLAIGVAAYLYIGLQPEEVKEIRIGIAGPLEHIHGLDIKEERRWRLKKSIMLEA